MKVLWISEYKTHTGSEMKVLWISEYKTHTGSEMKALWISEYKTYWLLRNQHVFLISIKHIYMFMRSLMMVIYFNRNLPL
jgi:hypothetical protein